MKRLKLWLVAALVLMAAPAYAFKLTPIEAEFGPGRLASQTFKVENSGAKPVAIELSVFSRAMAANGEDVLAPAPDDFELFPDQILLQPGETQSVRVQWTGSSAPATEIAYRLMAEQLPIDIGSDGAERSGLKLLVKYMAALYVRPADPAAVLTATIAADLRDGHKLAVIKVKNTGNAHAVLQDSMLEVSAGGQPVAFEPEQREAVHGKNILPGVERELLLPWSKAMEAGALTIELSPPANGH
jgi:fimbrial chaperone protein